MVLNIFFFSCMIYFLLYSLARHRGGARHRVDQGTTPTLFYPKCTPIAIVTHLVKVLTYPKRKSLHFL